jgi:hypothetical protein
MTRGGQTELIIGCPALSGVMALLAGLQRRRHGVKADVRRESQGAPIDLFPFCSDDSGSLLDDAWEAADE